MEQVRKALGRAKTAFEVVLKTHGIIDNEHGHASPGREIYEIDLALNELEQRLEACPVDAGVSGRCVMCDDEIKDDRYCSCSNVYEKIEIDTEHLNMKPH